ncbi:hypothetical protein Tco_1342361 [Tanacetum coccineum]
MSTSRISMYSDSDDESTGSSVTYIVLSDSEVEDTASPTTFKPPSPDYVLTSPNYVPASYTEIKPFEAPAT